MHLDWFYAIPSGIDAESLDCAMNSDIGGGECWCCFLNKYLSGVETMGKIELILVLDVHHSDVGKSEFKENLFMVTNGE